MSSITPSQGIPRATWQKPSPVLALPVACPGHLRPSLLVCVLDIDLRRVIGLLKMVDLQEPVVFARAGTEDIALWQNFKAACSRNYHD